MKTKIILRKRVKLKDPWVCARYKKSPEYGPKILFFSGGSSLRDTSKVLVKYTHNSIHLITPFDSGGSSAKIRKEFGVLSVGDLRNRLMALADTSEKSNKRIYSLFSYRLSSNVKNSAARDILIKMSEGEHDLILSIDYPMKSIISAYIKKFLKKTSGKFDFRGANIGNIVLAGGYLSSDRNIDSTLYTFTKLVGVKGIVKPVVQNSLNIVSELQNHSFLYGQHLITGKETPKIKSRIKRIYLSSDPEGMKPFEIKIKPDISNLIKSADLICYPFGSFYSSLISNFLPLDVGKSILANPNTKIYVPNTYVDPEMKGLDLLSQIKTISEYLKICPKRVAGVLNFVLLDTQNASYPFRIEKNKIEELGVKIIDTQLVSPQSYPKIDPKNLVKILVSMA
ncbi:GAK system CofD-like protein [candidate division WOR-3 bacterium]|nr:GAK system CofD-like protein [candidate division WOR-3 bacterium]